MIVQEVWQEPFLEALQHHLYANEDVLALVVFGSAGQSEMILDLWSDIDVLVVTTDKGLDTFFPRLDWVRPLAPIYAYEQHTSDLTYTTRLCFTDMRRVDFVFMTESALKRYAQVKFWQPGNVVFSKSTAVFKQLIKPGNTSSFSLLSPVEFERMANQFWYRSTVAVYKAIRDDRLIAWHLTLELIQECCVLGMMLRDRVEQSTYHRSGGSGNEIVTQLPSFPATYSTTAILDVIAGAAVLFDNLAERWSNEYVMRQRPLLDWIQVIKTRHMNLKGATRDK